MQNRCELLGMVEASRLSMNFIVSMTILLVLVLLLSGSCGYYMKSHHFVSNLIHLFKR